MSGGVFIVTFFILLIMGIPVITSLGVVSAFYLISLICLHIDSSANAKQYG